MIAALVATAAIAAAEPRGERLLLERGQAIVRVLPDGSDSAPLLTGAEARWSPDGTLIVFVRGGDLWTANADGSGGRRLTQTPNVVEDEPAWSPDGRSIVYSAHQRLDRIYVVGARAGPPRPIGPADAYDPVFSPDGRRIAFLVRNDAAPLLTTIRSDGSGLTEQGPLRAPDGTGANDAEGIAWSPDGRTVAVAVSDVAGSQIALVPIEDPLGTSFFPAPTAYASDPVWSPDGTQLAFSVTDPSQPVQTMVAALDGSGAYTVAPGRVRDWRRVPLGNPRFPDLVQRPPSGLVVTQSAHGRWLLGFTSRVDNRGPGILWLRGVRRPGASVMDVTQLLQLAGGGVRLVPHAGELHYTVAPPHYHWHFLGFDRYELRRADDFALLVRDRKSGFCLEDHYGIAQGVRHGPPRFLGDCAQFNPRARFVEEGSSVGYTDRYPANFHGQNLDLTRVPAGRYWLVHRVNSDHFLRELRYDNDAASLLVRIAWPHGRSATPVVSVLRVCSRERC